MPSPAAAPKSLTSRPLRCPDGPDLAPASHRNQCPDRSGLSARVISESVPRSRRNRCPDATGIRNLAEHTHGPVDYWLGWRPLTAQTGIDTRRGHDVPLVYSARMPALHAGGRGSTPRWDTMPPASGTRPALRTPALRFESGWGCNAGGASAQLRLISEAPWGQHPPPVPSFVQWEGRGPTNRRRGFDSLSSDSCSRIPLVRMRGCLPR